MWYMEKKKYFLKVLTFTIANNFDVMLKALKAAMLLFLGNLRVWL